MLKRQHLAGLMHYARHLWQDAQTLEKLWQQGELEEVAPITPEEKALARGPLGRTPGPHGLRRPL